jgi:phosphatidylinositol glycan class V
MPSINIRGYTFIALVAAASRIALLGVGFLSDAVLPDYDSSAELHSSSCTEIDAQIDESPFSRAVRSSIVWDTVYFEHLARCGYEFEQFFAFFPGLPTLMRLLSFARGHPWTQIAGILISIVSFTLSSVLFYRYALFEKATSRWS